MTTAYTDNIRDSVEYSVCFSNFATTLKSWCEHVYVVTCVWSVEDKLDSHSPRAIHLFYKTASLIGVSFNKLARLAGGEGQRGQLSVPS